MRIYKTTFGPQIRCTSPKSDGLTPFCKLFSYISLISCPTHSPFWNFRILKFRQKASALKLWTLNVFKLFSQFLDFFYFSDEWRIPCWLTNFFNVHFNGLLRVILFLAAIDSRNHWKVPSLGILVFESLCRWFVHLRSNHALNQSSRWLIAVKYQNMKRKVSIIKEKKSLISGNFTMAPSRGLLLCNEIR